MEKKYLAGNLNKNVAFGLAWLFNYIGALILLIVDWKTLDVEEKRELIMIVGTPLVVYLLFWTFIVPIAMSVVCIVNIILAFLGKKVIRIPGLYHIIAAIVK